MASIDAFSGCGGFFWIFVLNDVGVEHFLELKAGELFQAVEEEPEGGNEDEAGGQHDDGPTEEGHAANFGGEFGGAGGVFDDVANEDVIENGMEEEGSGHEKGDAAEQKAKGGAGLAGVEGVFEAGDVNDGGVKEKGLGEGALGGERGDDGEAEDEGNGGVLNGDPLRGKLEQTDAAGGEQAEQSDDGEDVPDAAFPEVVNAVGQREGEGDEEGRDGAETEPGLALGHEEGGDGDVEAEIGPEVFASGRG